MIDKFTTPEEIYEKLKTDTITLNTKFPYTHKTKTNNQQKTMYLGRIWFNTLLPDDYPLIDEPINEDKINGILGDIGEKYPPEKASTILSNINKHAFILSTINPITFTTDTFILPEHIQKKKDEVLPKLKDDPEAFQTAMVELANEFLDHLKSLDNGAYDIAMSKAAGSKGSPLAWAVLLIAKGNSVDIEGNISNTILNSVNSGFTLEEFYANASEARSTLYIRSMGAAEPGALARDTVYANASTLLNSDDCQTTNYLYIHITASIAKTIVGRNRFDEEKQKLVKITKKSNLIGQTILLRSPIYCQDPDGICQTCYGSLAKDLDTNQIGVMIGQVVNSEALEGYSMAARHQASQISVKKANFKEDMLKI